MPCEITINNNRTTTSRSCAEKRRENVEEVVRVRCRWLKRPAVLTRMRRQSAGRKGERESGLSSYQFPSSLRESVPRNVNNATEKYRRIDHFLLLPFSLSLFFPRVVYQSSDSRSPLMFIVIAERAIPAFWVDRRFGSTSTHVVERKEEGGMGLVSPKGFNPSRAIPL